MEKYILNCPVCGIERIYKSNSAFWLAKNKNTKCRNCATYNGAKHATKIHKLLEDTYESWYWIGFILADGSVSNNRLSLTLSLADTEHLQKFANYIGYTKNIIKHKTCSLSIKETKIIPLICQKFIIHNNKTYNPSIFKIPDNEFGYSLITGFIDGDGCIRHQTNRKDFILTIKNHSSWLPFLIQINKIISDKITTKINNQNYACCNITNTQVLIDFKHKILNLNIPYLQRKWDIIDLTFISKYIQTKNNKTAAFEMFDDNFKAKDIANILQLSQGTISKYKKEWKK